MDKLTRTVERGFAAMDRGFAAVADDISEIKKTMATKAEMASGFLRVEERLYSIEQEIKDIKRRLTKLEDAFEKKGYQNKQEMEELWKRVVAIEKQLKMQR